MSHSSPWFSAACVDAMVHRNHFFHLEQKDKSSESKVKFRQTSNCSKGVLEAAKLAYANKTKEFITSKKLGPSNFWKIANSVINIGKSALYTSSIQQPRVYSLLHLIKQNCLMKTFQRTLIFMTHVSF